jgi:nitroreductase
MELIDAIYNRRAVRSYTSERLDQPTILKLIEAAIRAPSAVNQQPWAFAVIRDKDELKHISREARRYILEAVPEDSPMARFKEVVADPAFDVLYGAPALIVVYATTTEAGACEDCAIAAENLMLAARAFGLGSCWIGLARPWLGQAESKKELGLEPHYTPVAPIIIGHPIAWPDAPGRTEPEIHWIGA